MDQTIPNEQVLSGLNSAWHNFSTALTGSIYRHDRNTPIISGTFYEDPQMTITTSIQTTTKPDGNLLLPSTPMSDAENGSIKTFALTTVRIARENKFSIQAPHADPENYFHVQKGRIFRRPYSPPSGTTVNTLGALASGLFLRWMDDQEILALVKALRRA